MIVQRYLYYIFLYVDYPYSCPGKKRHCLILITNIPNLFLYFFSVSKIIYIKDLIKSVKLICCVFDLSCNEVDCMFVYRIVKSIDVTLILLEQAKRRSVFLMKNIFVG